MQSGRSHFYIAGFPPDIQRGLAAVRQTIRKAAPEATEAIKSVLAARKTELEADAQGALAQAERLDLTEVRGARDAGLSQPAFGADQHHAASGH